MRITLEGFLEKLVTEAPAEPADRPQGVDQQHPFPPGHRVGIEVVAQLETGTEVLGFLAQNQIGDDVVRAAQVVAFVVAEGADLRLLAGNLTAFFRNESCGKCVPCRIGTERAVELIEGSGPLDVEGLSALADLLADTSICGLGQAALIPITSVIDGFSAQGEES